MGVYVLSPCHLERFSNKNSGVFLSMIELLKGEKKIVLDKEGNILNKYMEIAENNPAVASWLDLLNLNQELCYEFVDCNSEQNNNDIKFYLDVCCCVVKCHKIIVNSYQVLQGYKFDGNNIEHSSMTISVFDRSTVYDELCKSIPNNYIIDSVVATNGSSINKVKINQ